MALLKVRNVNRRFGALNTDGRISRPVIVGKPFALRSPSGCSAAALRRMPACFDPPDTGVLPSAVSRARKPS